MATKKLCGKFTTAMHENLAKVWAETYRVLVDGGIACINIGDATRTINGKFQLYPNHSRITEVCEKIGFTTLPYILWKKPTNQTNVQGQRRLFRLRFPSTKRLRHAWIASLFCCLGRGNFANSHQKMPCVTRVHSRKKQRDEWFSQIWTFKGTRQTTSELERRTAAYPEEIAERLIRMFSVKGETVLDPFLGSGTTTKIAMQNERNSIGYEAD